MLEEARGNQNTILAFSKMTRLLSHGYRITDLISTHFPPCLLKIHSNPVTTSSIRLMGCVYVAKLTSGRCAFRLDIDRKLSYAHSVEAVQKLLGNDLILQSYPETLRLAHIFSTFTANEVLAMQCYVVNHGDVRIVTRPNIRRILFGRFGKGPEG
jgi:hypothetical protein